MVDLVSHTLLLSTVVLDIHDVADFVVFHERGQADHALLTEFACEPVPSVSLASSGLKLSRGKNPRIARASTETRCVTHLAGV